MLIVHPSSTCDVCLEPFAWQNQTATPHAIPCGHIFCLQCLQSTHPSNCPLCRKAYIPERVKKLHVDPCTTETEDDNPVLQVNGFLRRLAHVSGDNTPEHLAVEVITEVNSWLAAHGPSEAVYRPLRNAVTALQRAISLHREATAARQAMQKQEEDLWKQIRLRDLDLQTARTVEENLLNRLQRTEEDCEAKLSRAEKARAEMEVEFIRMRAEHAQFREELAKYRANSQPPVQPGPRERYDRPVTSMSRRTSYSHSAHPVHPMSARNDPVHLHSDADRAIDASPSTSTIFEDAGLASRTKRMTRPSVVIPGAPECRRIIPPLPAPFRFSDFRGTSAPLDTPPSILVPSSSRPSVRIVDPDPPEHPGVRQPFPAIDPQNHPVLYDQTTPRASVPPEMLHRPRSPNYGFIPGVGYVHRSPTERSPAPDQNTIQTSSAPGLMLYSQSSQPVDITNPRTVEGAARAMAIHYGEIETHETTWGHVYHALVAHPNPSTTSLVTVPPDSAVQPNTSTSTSAATGLNILSPPARTSESPAPVTIQRRNNASPEPSTASSWGTVPSARSSRVSLLEELLSLPEIMANSATVLGQPASRHSSISDLRLARLPEPGLADTADTGSNRGTPRVHSDRPIRPWPGSDPTLPPSQGPSQRSDTAHGLASRVSHGQGSGDLSRAPDPAPATTGLGLALASSAPAHQQVVGQDDLQHVNRSLMQLVLEARNSRRQSRPVSIASADGGEELRSGSWEARAPHVEAAPGPGDRSLGHSSAAPASAAGASDARASRDPRSAQRRETVAFAPQATEFSRRRRHSNVTIAPPPPLASSVSFHSERHVSPPSAVEHLPRPPSASRPHDFGTFGQTSSGTLLNGGSLLLTMPPPGPNTSSAATSTGEPSSIRAPRPINGRANNIFAMWGSRNPR